MFKPVPGTSLLFSFLFAFGCIPHRSFVATPYEPVLVKKKGDLDVSAGVRPLKYFSLNATVAATDFVAIRAGYGGFFGLDNFNASLIFFKNYTKYGFFAAPSFNYQHNTIHRSASGFLFINQKGYRYNCEYFSPGLVFGFKIAGELDDPSQQFILKVQYNITNKYNYEFEKDNNSGLSSYQIYDNELLFHRIPSFFSFEPSYVFLDPLGPFFTLKFQLSALICQRVYKHDYEFNDGVNAGGNTIAMSKWHPVYFPLNFGAGLILNISAKEKKHFDSRAFE